MDKLIERIFNPWTKWEVYKSDQLYKKANFNFSPALGGEIIGEDDVLVDIYCRTHKFNGLKDYKQVIKYR